MMQNQSNNKEQAQLKEFLKLKAFVQRKLATGEPIEDSVFKLYLQSEEIINQRQLQSEQLESEVFLQPQLIELTDAGQLPNLQLSVELSSSNIQTDQIKKDTQIQQSNQSGDSIKQLMDYPAQTLLNNTEFDLLQKCIKIHNQQNNAIHSHLLNLFIVNVMHRKKLASEMPAENYFDLLSEIQLQSKLKEEQIDKQSVFDTNESIIIAKKAKQIKKPQLQVRVQKRESNQPQQLQKFIHNQPTVVQRAVQRQAIPKYSPADEYFDPNKLDNELLKPFDFISSPRLQPYQQYMHVNPQPERQSGPEQDLTKDELTTNNQHSPTSDFVMYQLVDLQDKFQTSEPYSKGALDGSRCSSPKKLAYTQKPKQQIDKSENLIQVLLEKSKRSSLQTRQIESVLREPSVQHHCFSFRGLRHTANAEGDLE